jgi:hypothetical protein
MPASLLSILTLISLGLTAAAARSGSPDDPGAAVRAERYQSLFSGTKSYRPVEPLPWGDVNRRVAPKADQGKRVPDHGKAPAPPHKH